MIGITDTSRRKYINVTANAAKADYFIPVTVSLRCLERLGQKWKNPSAVPLEQDEIASALKVLSEDSQTSVTRSMDSLYHANVGEKISLLWRDVKAD